MNPMTQFKKLRIVSLLIALAFVALAAPGIARADAVTDWNLIASNASSAVKTSGRLAMAFGSPAQINWESRLSFPVVVSEREVEA
jgi:hypothetical protein